MMKKVFALFLCFFIIFNTSFGIFVEIVYAADIVPDGQTATTLTINNNVTDISTGTIKGVNALNSFQKFNINSGNIVNLHLPANTTNLINLVHNERSQLDGMLNSIQNGEIGGNVFFLNPYGMMVGSQGSINVGSLTAVTPTQSFMDSFFVSPGNPSATSLADVIDGNIPLNNQGLISIRGSVNARNDIELAAGNINNSGEIISGAVYENNAADFSDVVNTNGLENANKLMVSENGDIEIKAAEDVINSGAIAADGAANLSGGNISIQAGRDIKMEDGALVSARGYGENSAGGEIISFADRNGEFNEGAVIDVSAGDSGDGGFIEFSAEKKVLLNGGQFRASAEDGENGNVLIDPEEITINSNHYTGGDNHSFEASKSITVNENIIISTRNTYGNHLSGFSESNSGNLDMIAPVITLKDGSMLLAHVINREAEYGLGNVLITPATNYTAGDITLTAEKIDEPAAFEADAVTRIELNGALLKGNNISLQANSTAAYSWDYDDPDDNLVQTGAAVLGLGTGFNVGYAKANGSAEIIINENSKIEAAGKVDLTAKSDVTASITTLAGGNKVAGIAFAYGDLDSRATVDVKSGARITANNLSLQALNNATLDVNAMGISTSSAYEAGIAVTDATVDSSAEIADGAKISTGNLAISAVNNNSFSTKASSMALEDAKAGVGAAIFTADTSAVASYAGEQSVAGPDGAFNNLTIEALDNTSKNITTAAATTGSSSITTKPIINGANSGVNYVRKKLGSTPGMDQASGTEHWKLAGAISYADTEQQAEAFIGENTEVNAAGDVAISGRVRNDNLMNRATSDVESNAPGENGSTATYSLSAAIAYGDYDHSAEAYLADNSSLTADHFGISSDVMKPYEKDWSKWDTVGDVVVKIGDILGLTTEGYITGYANAIGSAENVNIAGSAAYLDFTNNSEAYTGRGTEIYLRETGNWTTELPGAMLVDSLPADLGTLNWDTSLQIEANTEISGVYAAGNIFAILPGTEGGKGSIGGAYNQINYNNTTKAFISEGTTVRGVEVAGITTVPDITVKAESRENIVTVSPTAGKGSSWGVNGVFSMAKVNNETEASIDDEANLQVGQVNLQAEDKITDWSLSGAFNKSENVGVGSGTAINDVTTKTSAYIGDNDQSYLVKSGDTLSEIALRFGVTVEEIQIANGLGSDTIYVDQELNIPYGQGQVAADEINLAARTDGKIESIAVAGVITSSINNYSMEGASPVRKAKSKMPLIGNKLAGKTGSDSPAPARPSFGLGISGSVAYNITDLNTSAYAADSILDFSGENAGGLTLSAINNTDITAGSGAGALIMADSPATDYSVGIAGSVAINDLYNTTSAYGDNLTIIQADDVDIKALSGGEALAVAIGASVNLSDDQSTAASVAGSVSVNMTENDVDAYLKDSNLTGNSTEVASNLSLVAYDQSKFGTGSGSLLAGGKAGIGTAISYSSINNQINSYLAGTTAADFNNIDLHALNAYQIGSGGGMASLALAEHSLTLSGSFVINEVDNETNAEIKAGSELIAKDEIDLLARDTAGVASLNELITAGAGASSAGFSYDGSGWTETERTEGSSILSVAGLVQLSGNNAGISMTWNDVKNDFTASVNNSELTTTADEGTINVKALSSTDITGLALGAGIALHQFAGAGSVVINEISNTTVAEVKSDSTQSIASDHLNVTAEDNTQVNSLAGQVTVSIGKVALGGAVIDNQINNSATTTVSGIELAVDETTLINAIQDGRIRSLAASGVGSAGISLNGAVMNSYLANHTSASLSNIQSNSETNLVSVVAEDKTDLETISGAATVGLAAIGGAVTVNNLESTTEAVVSAGSESAPVKLGGLAVKTTADQSISGAAYQGSGGWYFSAGAAVVDNNIDHELSSTITAGSNLAIYNGDLKVQAVDQIDIDAEAQGYTVGAVAAGAVIANANRTGDTLAGIGNEETEAKETTISMTGGEMLVNSERAGKVASFTRAGAGGVYSGAGSDAEAEDKGKVAAKLGNNIQLTGIGTDVEITASGRPQISAKAEGYNGSLTAGAGVSIAKANADLDIIASIGSDGKVTADSLTVKALHGLNNNQHTAYSSAIAVSGGLLLGANATSSTAASSSSVNSFIDSDLLLNRSLKLITDNTTSQKALVTGVVAGAAAVGGNFAKASSNSNTTSRLGAVELNGGSLELKALGEDINYADSTAGSGGIVAGAAADSRTDSISNLNAIIDGEAVAYTDDFKIIAEQLTDYNSRANSINAAVVGYSGAYTKNDVDATVKALLGDQVKIYTTGIDIQATNSVKQSGKNENVKGGAGGVINGSAVESNSTVDEITQLNIGQDAILKVIGNPMNNSLLNLGVNNKLNVFDETVLKTGGAIQRPYADTSHTAELSGTVNIGDGAELSSSGDLQIRSYTDASVFTSSLVKTYGGVGAAGGNAVSNVTAKQNITTGEDVYLMSYGDLELAVGKSGDGWWFNNINSRARTEVYNYTALPIDTSPYAEANVYSINNLTVGEGNVLESGRNITLATYEGKVEAGGSGTGHNPYLEALGTTTEDGHNSVNSSSWMVMNGTATAGIFHDQSLNIDSYGNISTGKESRNINYNKRKTNPQSDLQAQINYLNFKKEYASSDEEKGELQAQIDVLEMLKSSVAGTQVDVVKVNDIYAAGGNITVDTNYLYGTANLTAYGGPKIVINNDSDHYLYLDQLFIPDADTGGAIHFNGAVGRSQAELAGFNVTEIDKGVQSRILINNNYDTGSGDGPAIFLREPVENQRGLIKIFNQSGSLAQFTDVRAQQYQVDVPNGSFIVNNPGGFYYATAEPSTAWTGRDYRPISANQAMALAAKYYFKHYSSDRFIESNYGGYFNSFLRDPDHMMYGDNKASGGKTYVLLNLPNIHGDDAVGNVPLFDGGFKMWGVADWNLQKSANYNDGNHYDGAPITAKQVGVNAKYIDINGKIRAGVPGDWSVNIASGLDDWMNEQTGSGLIEVPATYYQIENSGDLLPTLKYNINDENLVLDDINASGGGFVYLHGNIISTNKLGNIEVLNGFGNVQVNNESSKPLVIGDIDTGQQTVGIIKIADTAKDTTTWYVNTLGGGTKVYQDYIYGAGDYNNADDVTGSVGLDTYTPLQGQRYQWENTCTLERSFGGVNDLVEGDEAPFYRIKQPSGWQNTSGWNTDKNYTVTTGNSADMPYFKEEVSYGYLSNWYSFSVDAADSSKGWPTGSTSDWYYKLPQKAKLTLTASVKADNSIGISFTGNDTASVNIDSAAGISLGGRIDNIFGGTLLKAVGSGQGIVQSADAVLNSENILLRTDKNIGSASNPVRFSLNNSGNISAVSNHGDIYLEAPTNSVVIGKILAGNQTNGYGDISLTAAGDINTSGTSLIGSNINLISESGAVGSSARPLQIEAIAAEHSSGKISGGEVSVAANGNIYLVQSEGDFRLLKAHSGQGDVNLTVNNGNIINVVEEQRIDPAREEELAEIWDRLALTAEHNAQQDAENTTVKPFENSVNRTYQEYWYLYNNGQLNDEGLVLNTDAIDYYKDRAAAVMGITDPTAVEVQSYAAEMFTEYRTYFNDLFGSDWEDQSQFQAYQVDYSYTASAEKTAELTYGAEWLPSQLIYEISQNALKPDSGGQLVTQEANIIGNNIVVETSKAIGSLDEPIEIEIPETGGTISLTAREKAALVRASMPGDITINYEGTRPSGISVLQTNPVYLNATENIYLDAVNEVFINSGADLNIAALQAGGDIRVITDGNIINQSAGTAIIGGGNLALESAGSIGKADKFLSYQLDGMLASAIAGEDIYLERIGEDLKLGRMSAGNKVSLKVNEGGLYGQYSGLSLLAESLELDVRDGVSGAGYQGGEDQSLMIELGTEGEISGYVGGKTQLASPVTHLNLGNITTGDDFTLFADSLTTTGEVDVTGDLDLQTTKDLIIEELIKADLVQLTAGGKIAEGDAGRINTSLLLTNSGQGQKLTGNNQIEVYQAVNSGSGDIVLNNNHSLLEIAGINQNDGIVEVTNTGEITITDSIKTGEHDNILISGGNTTITDAGSITSGISGDITINTRGYQKINGAVTAGGDGEIKLQAVGSEDIDIIINSSLSSSSGKVEIESTGDTEISGEITTSSEVRINVGGKITETGSGKIVRAELLNTISRNGQLLNGENSVQSFAATNKGSGNIELNNNAEELVIDEINQLAKADVKLTNQGSIAIDEITLASGDLELAATESINNWQESATSNINAVNIDLTAVNGSIGETDNYLLIDSANPVAGLVNASAGDNIYLIETIGQIAVGQFTAGKNIVLNADQSILNGNRENGLNFTAENITLLAENGSIGEDGKRITTAADQIINLSAYHDIHLAEITGDLNSEVIASSTGVIDLLTPQGSIIVESITAPEKLTLNSAEDITINELDTAELKITAESEGSKVALAEARISERMDAEVDNLSIDSLIHNGESPLIIEIAGGSNKLADEISINAKSETGIIFNHLAADYSVIDADVESMKLLKTIVGSRAEINNSYGRVVADIRPQLFDSDLQLYPRRPETAEVYDPFYLIFTTENAGRKILTDAYIVNYNPDFIINQFSTENSIMRITSKLAVLNSRLMNNNLLARTGNNFNQGQQLVDTSSFSQLGNFTDDENDDEIE